MARPASTFNYYKKELEKRGFEVERIKVGRGFFRIYRDGELIFTARNYNELRAFLIGLDEGKREE